MALRERRRRRDRRESDARRIFYAQIRLFSDEKTMQGEITLPSIARPIDAPKIPVNRAFQLTPEMIEKAKSARAAAKAARDASPLRRTFADSQEWDELARQYAVRLPPWGQAPTASVMRTFLRRAKVSAADYLEWSGEKGMEDFARNNPEWPARAWAGCVLEWKAS